MDFFSQSWQQSLGMPVVLVKQSDDLAAHKTQEISIQEACAIIMYPFYDLN